MSHRKGICEVCGKQTSYKAYKRCLSCARKGSRNPNWGKFTSTANEDAGRQRAQHRFELDICERCGKAPATDRHHRNDDPLDNRPENIQRLCRRCHMAVDGRLTKMTSRNRAGRKFQDNAEKFRAMRARRKAEGRPLTRIRGTCEICGKPTSRPKYRRCRNCFTF